MNDQIEPGDYVTHKTNSTINNGLMMSVEDVNETEAQVSYFRNNKDQQQISEWFRKSDLVLLHKANGGFLDPK